MVHGLSCSVACGIFPDQRSNLCPLRAIREVPQLHFSEEETEVLRGSRDRAKLHPGSISAASALSLQPALSFFLNFPGFYTPRQTVQREDYIRNMSGEDLMAGTAHKLWVFVSAGLRVPSRDANGGLDQQC